MQPLKAENGLGRVVPALLLLLAAYILALFLPTNVNMGAPLQKIIPRISSLANQLSSARSLLPTLHYRNPFGSPSPTTSQTHFSTTTANMTHDTMNFRDAIKHRRTVYQLQKKSTISDAKIEEILQLCIKDVPSSFNSQSARIVALLHDQHDKFWQIVEDKLRPIVEEQGGSWQKTADRISMFKNAYGTILFYEDSQIVHGLQEKMQIYADKFPQWSEHTSAMHQYMLWTAFEAEGLGCNLQHYNPLPDEEVAKEWNVPKEWDLKAQLVIGTPAEGARDNLGTKSEEPIDGKRLFVYGAQK